jgi:hypothetical protein
LAVFGANKSILLFFRKYTRTEEMKFLPIVSMMKEEEMHIYFFLSFLAIKYPSQFPRLNFTFADATTTPLGCGASNSSIYTS